MAPDILFALVIGLIVFVLVMGVDQIPQSNVASRWMRAFVAALIAITAAFVLTTCR